ncbi:adenine specific DNA methyltransferase domain protein (plasmid) [Borreliella bissettiae DN127]|uniref:Adenine specific DNA methyltransferase domain protein n=1 Tax=Borrelia bissettiae (strain DSM 17990 / CIP 109136 / DN127) TaxID=521010 RepID=G0AP32_BORBD|nr:adenine specific DNA methyltransferase domain protein [Borreliella bissettiae DN127]
MFQIDAVTIYVFPLYIKEDQSVFKDLIKENFKIPFRKFINTNCIKKSLREKGSRGVCFYR